MRASSLIPFVVVALFASLAACGADGEKEEDPRDDRDATDIAPLDVGQNDVPDALDAGDTAAPDTDDAIDDAGLDGSGDASDAGPQSETAFIQASGGIIDFDRVRLTFTRGAVNQETAVTIAFSDFAAPEDVEPLTPIYRFTPENTVFATTVAASFTLDEEDGAAQIFWTELDSENFRPLASDVSGTRVSGTISHFSYGFVGRFADDLCGGDPVNTCGGCVALTGEFGAPCGNGGTLACTEDLNELLCEGEAVCGDAIVGGDEGCDGESLGGLVCIDFAQYDGGSLSCDGACALVFDACTGPDPCEGVACDLAPDTSCEGNTAVSFALPGTCSLGECEFTETREDCGSLTCRAGECSSNPVPGDLVITEFLADVDGEEDGNEWFEVYNTSARDIGLRGLVVRDDDGDSFTVNGDVTIAANQWFVFGASETAVPSGVDFNYGDVDGSWALANGGDEIVLEWADEEIDRVTYTGGWPGASGRSAQLDDDALALDNDDSDVWCDGIGVYGFGLNEGTPGDANPDCDPVDLCEGVFCDEAPAARCEGDLALMPDAFGTCAAGVCSYPERAFDCTEFGGCADGACVTPPARPAPGDIEIREFLPNPLGDDVGFEWVEIENVSGVALDLSDIVLRDDGGDRVSIPFGTVLAADRLAVLAASAEAVPGDVLIEWRSLRGGFTLTNTSDEIVIDDEGVTVARVAYASGWSLAEGRSTSFGRESRNPSDADEWCSGSGLYGIGGNEGSPGEANDYCVDPCDSVTCDSAPVVSCNGDLLIEYVVPGMCMDGFCSYEEAPFDCAEFGGCAAGVCVVDPCAAVACDAPPVDACEGEVAVQYEPLGVCARGDCSYAEERSDCTEFGGCLEGVCAIEARAPAAGELVLTEFFADAPGADGDFEWFELHNVTDETLNLAGVTVGDDGADSFLVETVTLIGPGEFAVFVAAETTLPAIEGLTPIVYGGEITIGNTIDEFVVSLEDLEIDRVVYDTTAGWEVPTGATLSLDATALDNSVPGAWCEGVEAYNEAGFLGTPGASNPACPIDLCAAVVCETPPADGCVGDVAALYSNPGVCVEGICQYETNQLDCTDFGGCVDAACVTPPEAAAAGDLQITEIMVNPLGTDSGAEWLEVWNTTDGALDLSGVVVSDAGTQSFAVPPLTYLGPSEFLVFGSDVADYPGAEINWSPLGTFTLTNNGDAIILTGEVEIDRVFWDATWPITEGYSMSLNPGSLDNDLATSWCLGRGSAADPNRGTPTLPNVACADIICGDGLTQEDEECDDGNTEDGDGCDSACVREFVDPCAGVVCNTPPLALCEASLAITFGVAGTCAEGECSYTRVEEDCSEEGGFCVDGACVSGGGRPAAPGDLVITEIMPDPTAVGDDTGEWFEVLNLSGDALSLTNVELTDDGGQTVVIDGLAVI
ncbi:MAG: cysteine-rich repeat protein, partial [Bradymonadia bacterium]